MAITITTTGWLPGRTETMRWPPKVAEADQIEVEYRGLTVAEDIHADEIATLAAASAYEPPNGPGGEPDPMRTDKRKGWLRRLVEAFRMGVVEIRGLQTRGPDGAPAPWPEKGREDGFEKWSLALVGALRRELPGLIEVAGRRIVDATELSDHEKKASSGTSGRAASGPDGTAPAAPNPPGVAAAAATSLPASEPPCSTA